MESGDEVGEAGIDFKVILPRLRFHLFRLLRTVTSKEEAFAMGYIMPKIIPRTLRSCLLSWNLPCRKGCQSALRHLTSVLVVTYTLRWCRNILRESHIELVQLCRYSVLGLITESRVSLNQDISYRTE